MRILLRLASPQDRLRWIALAPVVLLALLIAVYPPDGASRAQMAQFVGRFHLLTVHFPIALLLVVPVLEIAGRHERLPHLRASVDFILVLAMIASLVAAGLGWCLARSSSYSGRLVTQHMWGGVAVAAACWVCWMLRARIVGPRLSGVYIGALAATVALVSWTGYRGGQISQGENHLTEAMPDGLRHLFAPSAGNRVAAAPDSATFYGAKVQPILAANCTSCHGSEKRKGGLRLDSYDAILRGGKDGPVIKGGDAKDSVLFQRISLKPGEDGAMPPDGKKPLTADEVKLIELWIANGASATGPVSAIQGAPTGSAPAAALSFEMADPVVVAKARAPLAAAVAHLQARYPGVLNYESRGSVGLVLHASLLGEKFGNEDVAALKPISGAIVEADFSSTGITDRSAADLAAMQSLRTLRLMHTKITDATVLALGNLGQLESLSVFDTGITPESLAITGRLPKLQHFYVGETKVRADAALPPAEQKVLQF
ncbi:MAG: c-type cytochrome domain-containing protein [Acidobacteriota bacterium]